MKTPERLLSLLLVLSLPVGCAVTVSSEEGGSAPPAEPAAAAGLLASHDLVDLTHPLSPDSLYWPNGEPFVFERLHWGYDENGENWYTMARFETAEHLGTHLDAPIHFAPEVWASADIPVERFVGPAVVVDIRDRATNDPDAVLEPADLEAWRERNGEIPEGAIVLVRSGWSERWPDWNAYYGSDDPFDTTTLHFPGVSAEAAEALAATGVVGVGIDTASIDPGNDTEFRAHRILAAAQLYNLENLTGLDALPESGAILFALPIKIEGGSGGPARVVALVPR